MMMNDKKKAALLIISKSDKPMNKSEDMNESKDMKEMVSEDIMDAIKSEDKEKFMHSMKAFVQMCMDEYNDDMEEDKDMDKKDYSDKKSKMSY